MLSQGKSNDVLAAAGPSDSESTYDSHHLVEKHGVYYGWTIIGVSFVNLAITFGIWYSFSVFFLAILKEFGWGRAASAGVFSTFMVVHSVVAIVIGSLIDRFGARKVIPLGSILVVVGLVASSRVQALYQLYLFYGVVTAVGICSMGFLTHGIIIPNWFVKKRGLALGLAMAGIGVGMQILVPITQSVISRFGWRAAYCVLAAIVLIIVIPLNAVFQRRNPAEVGELPDGEKIPQKNENRLKEEQSTASIPENETKDWTLGSTLKTRRFWFLFTTFFFTPMAIQGTLIHQVAHVTDRGFSPEIGAFFFGLVGIMGSVGKILFGYLSDRIGREKAFTIGAGCAFLGVLNLMNVRPGLGPLLYGYAILFGLGYGAIAPIFPARAADLFQGPHFGRIYGFLALSAGFGGGAGTWISGKVFDVTASYHMAFLGILTVLVIIALLFRGTSPPPVQEE